MKYYRVLDMTLRKFDSLEEEYKVGSHGTFGGAMIDLNKALDTLKREKENMMRYYDLYSSEIFSEQGGFTILKDEPTEFQCRIIEKLNDDRVSETVYCIKVSEMKIDLK